MRLRNDNKGKDERLSVAAQASAAWLRPTLHAGQTACTSMALDNRVWHGRDLSSVPTLSHDTAVHRFIDTSVHPVGDDLEYTGAVDEAEVRPRFHGFMHAEGEQTAPLSATGLVYFSNGTASSESFAPALSMMAAIPVLEITRDPIASPLLTFDTANERS